MVMMPTGSGSCEAAKSSPVLYTSKGAARLPEGRYEEPGREEPGRLKLLKRGLVCQLAPPARVRVGCVGGARGVGWGGVGMRGGRGRGEDEAAGSGAAGLERAGEACVCMCGWLGGGEDAALAGVTMCAGWGGQTAMRWRCAVI